jgi:hypothetical protein
VYPKIVPLHLQEELIQIGEDITKHTFRIGDIVIAVNDFVDANGFDCSKRDVWRAVGSFIGKAANTVRGYEALAIFYSHSVRQHYDILSASHFRMAMRIDSQTDYSWQTVLDYAVDRIDDYGRPATVDELMKVFIYNSEPFEPEDEEVLKVQHNSIDDFIDRLSGLKRDAELLPLPERARSELMEVLRRIEYVVNSLMVQV